MARESTKRKRLSKSKSSAGSKAKKKALVDNSTKEADSAASPSDEGSDDPDNDNDDQCQLQELSKNVADCRIALEQVLVTLKDLQCKVDLLENRVTEVQLNRMESMGPREAFIARKRSGCSNEKDSLFKECFESSLSKLRVSVL